jgi:hypothetical protein
VSTKPGDIHIASSRALATSLANSVSRSLLKFGALKNRHRDRSRRRKHCAEPRRTFRVSVDKYAARLLCVRSQISITPVVNGPSLRCGTGKRPTVGRSHTSAVCAWHLTIAGPSLTAARGHRRRQHSDAEPRAPHARPSSAATLSLCDPSSRVDCGPNLTVMSAHLRIAAAAHSRSMRRRIREMNPRLISIVWDHLPRALDLMRSRAAMHPMNIVEMIILDTIGRRI